MNMSGPVEVPVPQARIIYEGKDISADISPYLLSVGYTDRLSGESDELELRLEDTDGRWRGDWYPGKGDSLTVSIGYAGQEPVSCGSFEIDEIELSFPPDEVSIRALATGISVSCRTRKSKGYEKTTLAGVVRVVCGRLGLTPAGEVADIPLDRVTQYQESDLAFLTRLAGEYGHTFKISGKKMIFQRKDSVLTADSARTFKREDVTSCSFRDKLKDIPQKVKIKKQEPQKKPAVTSCASWGAAARRSLKPRATRLFRTWNWNVAMRNFHCTATLPCVPEYRWNLGKTSARRRAST